jgi:hypothetical protein
MRTGEGWHTAAEHDPEAREVEMDIRVEHDGSGYLVIAESSDGSVFADDWCESLEEAVEMAEEEYGVHSWDAA